MANDLRQFNLSVDRFAADTPKLMSQLLRRAALMILRDLVKGSPVDTGRFRASWFVGIAVPNRDTMPALDNYPNASALSNSRIAALTPTTVTGLHPIILSNNLPYGPALADGHSGQAPSGWIDTAVSRAQRALNAERVVR